MSTSVSGIPISISSSPISISSSESLSSSESALFSLNETSFQCSAKVASLCIMKVLPIQVDWMLVLPFSEFSVTSSPIENCIIPMFISVITYIPSGDIAMVVENVVISPSSSTSLPSVVSPPVSPQAGPWSKNRIKSATVFFKIASV